MLNLYRLTDEGWFDRILPHLDTLLLDHTHLEKRAASGAMNMLFRYTDDTEFANALAEVVHEELEHFTRMLALLKKRKIAYGPLEPASYAAVLMKSVRKNQDQDALLDKLLISGLIEARSCERFKILSEKLEDKDLAEFYAELFTSEARHHTLYTKIARRCFGDDVVKIRLAELAKREWEAIEASKGEFRLHSY